jgi:amino acid transporter
MTLTTDSEGAVSSARLHTAELKKDLRVGDLMLAQILYITSFVWLGPAAKLGSSQIICWIPAVLFFYIPSGIVVLHLNREMPLEGGIYQWVKLRLGPLAGFLVALNLWATLVLLLAGEASSLTNILSYLAGPGAAWIIANRSVTMLAGAILMASLMLVAARGLAVGRWVHNLGALVLLSFFAGMVLLALPSWIGRNSVTVPVALHFPGTTLLNLNLIGKLGFGAFCGLDGTSIFSGECRDPNASRAIRRAIYLAGPVIALLYIVGTICVLTFSAPPDIDMTSPATQALSRGAAAAGISNVVLPLITVLGFCGSIGLSSLYLNIAVRMPMVAGWDHLLPAWFSRLHPRFATPVGSILFIGATATVITVLTNLGVGGQEAYQTCLNAGIICWALTYIAMFAIPLAGWRARPPLIVILSAAFAMCMTLLYVALSIFPVVTVRDSLEFTAKVAGLVVALNIAGTAYYMSRAQRSRVISYPGR